MFIRQKKFLCTLCTIIVCAPNYVYAKDAASSPFLTGPLGLNTISNTHTVDSDSLPEKPDRISSQTSFGDQSAQWPLLQIPEIHAPTLRDIHSDGKVISASLQLDSSYSSSKQVGQAAKALLETSDQDTEIFEITPFITNLRGPKVSLLRSDIEKSYTAHNRSPQEIWRNTSFSNSDASKPSWRTSSANQNKFAVHLEEDIDLAMEERSLLHRTSLLVEHKNEGFLGFLRVNQALRLNLSNNLDHLQYYRNANDKITKGNIDEFSNNAISLDHAYLSYNHSFTSKWHGNLSIGYLDEFYVGAGAEILYRPFDSRFAFSAEIWDVVKRDPYTALNAGWGNETSVTGFASLWYDIPYSETTAQLQIGRFLAGDQGIKLGLSKRFINGVRLSGDFVINNDKEANISGSDTNTYHSLNLNIPLGNFQYIPEGSEARLKNHPMGRNNGQTISIQSTLNDLVQKLSLGHISNHFRDITK